MRSFIFFNIKYEYNITLTQIFGILVSYYFRTCVKGVTADSPLHICFNSI